MDSVCEDMRASGAGLPASAAQAAARAWADDIKEDMHKIEEDSKKNRLLCDIY